MLKPFTFTVAAAFGIAVYATLITLSIEGSYWGWLLALVAAPVALYLVFRDTMNQFQWFPFWGKFPYRLYWVTKDNANPATRHVGTGSMYFDISDAEFFHGSGLALRWRNYSFQLGVGRIVHTPIWYRDLDVSVDEIKKGVDGVWEQEESVSQG